MMSTSNDGIISEYLIEYAVMKSSKRERPNGAARNALRL